MAQTGPEKVVAITGASSGIGAATAMLLAERGAKVLLGARRTDRLGELARRIADTGGEAVPVRVDVRRRDDLTALVATARQFRSTDTPAPRCGGPPENTRPPRPRPFGPHTEQSSRLLTHQERLNRQLSNLNGNHFQ